MTEPLPPTGSKVGEPDPQKVAAAWSAGPPVDPKLEPKPGTKLEPRAGALAALPATEAKPTATVGKRRPEFKNTLIFSVALLGLAAGLVAAYLFGRERKPQAPVFPPVTSPYETAIYANGIIESDQPSGENVNIFPEVTGPVTQVLVREGQLVTAGTPLLTIDDSVQKAATEQLRLQSEAALALLEELQAQPRRETLAITVAQVSLAEANLLTVRHQYDKDRAAYDSDPKSISRNVLDTAEDAMNQAAGALDVARKQFELTQAGAWSFDILSQQKAYAAAHQAYLAANALLQKHGLKAPVNGVVLALNVAVGGYVSSTGAFDPYTQLFAPLVIMGAPQEHLAVRCYVDEILVARLPAPFHIRAQLTVAGSSLKVPLEFVRVQPYVSPKIELANQRQEKVDLRVLPVIFRFEKKDAPVYPGQLVDVYIGQQ